MADKNYMTVELCRVCTNEARYTVTDSRRPKSEAWHREDQRTCAIHVPTANVLSIEDGKIGDLLRGVCELLDNLDAMQSRVPESLENGDLRSTIRGLIGRSAPGAWEPRPERPLNINPSSRYNPEPPLEMEEK
jgi:hypothetical protein